MAVHDPLYRSRDDRMIAGVAAGVAEAIDADPSIIRAGSTASMGATVPTARPRRDPVDRARGGLFLGLILIVIGVIFLIREFLPFFDIAIWWPIAAIGLGVVLVLFALTPSRRSG